MPAIKEPVSQDLVAVRLPLNESWVAYKIGCRLYIGVTSYSSSSDAFNIFLYDLLAYLIP